MKNLISIFLSALVILTISTNTIHAKNSFSHELWNQLLAKNVSQEGKVYYEGFQINQNKINQYLDQLSANPPAENWSDDETKAYWINAYNAFTIKLILDYYPINSIKDIKEGGQNAWDISFIKIGNKTYSLNQIEHGILRTQFKDPRIHFALNCTAISCPRLFNRAYTIEKLDQQLDLMARIYINDLKRNKISANSVQLSKIFEWYASDFTEKGSLIDFLNIYSKTRINQNAAISYLEYDWGLNN